MNDDKLVKRAIDNALLKGDRSGSCAFFWCDASISRPAAIALVEVDSVPRSFVIYNTTWPPFTMPVECV